MNPGPFNLWVALALLYVIWAMGQESRLMEFEAHEITDPQTFAMYGTDQW